MVNGTTTERPTVLEQRPFSPALAILLGLALVVGTNVAAPVVEFHYQVYGIARTQFPIALLFFVLIVSFVVNPLLGLASQRMRIRRDEVAGALVIGFVGAAMPSLVGRFLSTITAPAYFASAENQWPAFVTPYLRKWLVPSDEAGAVTSFYQGLPEGGQFQWGAWAVPLFWWLSFIAAIFLACVAIAVILRRQWVEHERLAFPFAEVPLGIVRESQGGTASLVLPTGESSQELFSTKQGGGTRQAKLGGALLRNRLFWIGFAVPFLCVVWNVVGYFYPGLPPIRAMFGYPFVRTARDFPPIYTRLDFYIIGFAYFTPLDILFSLWLARALLMLQVGVSRRVGFGAGSLGKNIRWQCFGGLAVFVFWGLWMARSHLLRVFRAGLALRRSPEDGQELLSYRSAVWLLLVSFCYLVAWLMRIGMNLGVVLLFLVVCLVIYLGMAKIIAMAGLISLKAPAEAGEVVSSIVGTRVFDPSTRLSLNMMMALFCINKGFAMPGAATSARLGEELPSRRHAVGKALVIGGLLALLVAVSWHIVLAYQDGAQNYEGWVFNIANKFPYDETVTEARNPTGTEWQPLSHMAFGGVLVAVLTAALYRFSWWPLHPVGFTVAATWTIEVSAFSLFLAWALKLLILKVGGVQLYRRSQVIILGSMAGYALAVGISMVVDIIFFPGQGHPIHSPPM